MGNAVSVCETMCCATDSNNQTKEENFDSPNRNLHNIMSNTTEKHLQRRLLLLFSNLYIMHITTVAFSPIAMFATPSQIKHRPFQPSTTTLHASLQEFSSKLSSTYPKIKSPSNYYSQFYKEGVLVGIENTSPNSRRISGEIIIDTNIDDIWSILSDYDNLSTNVPNLVESKVINNVRGIVGARPRVYQRGAIGIFGFEFGADVTMDMTESIVVAGKSGKVTKSDDTDEEGATTSPGMFPEERRIGFKCVDSQFFSEFDGTWRVVQMPDNPFTGQPGTTVSYTVEVRPKGPVPVGALEWRIREDVPTNLRAVKKAAIEVGYEGVHGGEKGAIGKVLAKLTGSSKSDPHDDNMESMDFADFILDYENETLGAYLD